MAFTFPQKFPLENNVFTLSLNLDFIQLSEPFRIFEFDFWRKPESSREMALRIKATHDGQAHALVSW